MFGSMEVYMQETFLLLLKVLHISMLNILLSFDNISVITVITSNLPKKFAKKAYMIGLSISILFSILFTSIISLIMEIKWFPIQLLGALLLIKITVDMLKSQHSKKDNSANYELGNIKIIMVILKITMVSLSLSFDNMLAIAGAGNGNIKIISYGLLLSLPVILIACQFIMKLLKKKLIFLYISGAILIYTALEMIFTYRYISPYIPSIIANIISLTFSFSVILYGIYALRKIPLKTSNKIESNDSD
jgi:YjbE family integral membrane protein